jgi:HD superfamily phosphohydrolase
MAGHCVVNKNKHMDNKIIRDSLHGYISIPRIVVSEIIDTPIFQRLKRIEQTSMRPLYPSAHHDRFIHSLGVYYLGDKALNSLINNVKSDDRYYSDDKVKTWEHYGLLFKIACLLHDCAHAPFSHSFEFAYLGDRNSDKWENVKEILKNSLADISVENNDKDANASYTQDIDTLFNDKPAPHEVLSAIVVAHYYSRAIERICKELNAFTVQREHIEFIQRAILGMKYNVEILTVAADTKMGSSPIDERDSIEWAKKRDLYNILNCLIQLLNSKSFDVDKLDYIMRDSAAAGINNLSVDVERLLGALTIIEKHKFNEKTKINEDVNHSITIHGKKKTSKDAEQTCALKLSLNDVQIDGKFNGSITTAIADALNTIGEFTTKYGSDNKVIEGRGKINGRVNNAQMKGSFIGSIATSSSIDGFMKCHMDGEICGEIIGIIDNWHSKGITIYEIGYKQSALSVIDDTITARNRLYLWVYAHHKVTYIDYLLRYAVLRSLLGKETNQFDYKDYLSAKENIENLLGLNIFDGKDPKNYLIDDSKFISLIKDSKNDFAEKYLSRKKEFSIWKNFAEYNMYFYDLTYEEKKKIWQSLFDANDKAYESYKNMKEGAVQMFPESILKDYRQEQDYEFVWIKPSGYKVTKIESNKTYLISNDKSVRRLHDILETDKTAEEYVDENYFYLYTSKLMSSKEKFELISFIKSKIVQKRHED